MSFIGWYDWVTVIWHVVVNFRDVMIYATTVDVTGLPTAMNILSEAALRPVIEDADVSVSASSCVHACL